MDIIKQRIVVKVGTSTLTHESGSFNLRSMEHLVRVLADLQGMGHEVILVSSGAIGVGTARLGLSERPKELRMKQAAAADQNDFVAHALQIRQNADHVLHAAQIKTAGFVGQGRGTYFHHDALFFHMVIPPEVDLSIITR